MTLLQLPLELDETPLPNSVNSFLTEARLRIDRFFLKKTEEPILAFVPSDYAAVYRALQHIQNRHLAAGTTFCEWGSGFGVIAGLAAMLEFDACGIEIEDELHQAAMQLAADFEVPVDFAQGTFIPEGGDCYTDELDNLSWLRMAGGDAYQELGLELDDFDIVFVYPWPGEERFVEELFDHFASVGALLLTYHGVEELRLHRKCG